VRGFIASHRYALPMVAAVVCCVAASYVSPILQWLLVVAAFGFVLDAATAWFERAGGTGAATLRVGSCSRRRPTRDVTCSR
jgi:hypothetical protein